MRLTPIFGNCNIRSSEKRDKQLANRAFRRKTRVAIINNTEPPNDLNEVSNVYSFKKDGKGYWKSATPKDMRK
jgi:ribosomal protein L36